MRTRSWDAFGVDRRRGLVLTVAVAAAASLAVTFATYGILGQLALVLGVIVCVGAGYTVAATPKRALERSALIQSTEAPALAASAAIYLESTGSRAKTLLMLRSGESRLSSFLREIRRRVLLGEDVEHGTGATDGLVRSESVRRVLRSVFRADGGKLQDEGEEMKSIFSSSQAGEETKFPIFMTISFFLPIMLMLFASIAHHTDIIALASLTFVEIVVLDLALSFSSTERSRLATSE